MRAHKLLLTSLGMILASPALAVVVPYGGTVSGVDPLGHPFSASGTHWGSPGYLAGTLAFNPGAFSNGNGSYATSFSFTWLKGVAGVIDQTPSATPFGNGPETRFSNITDGVAWIVTYTGRAVTFTAPNVAARLDVGDLFFVNVAFTGNIDPARFSFAALWDDARPVPEPASWALMLCGFGLLGGVSRLRRAAGTDLDLLRLRLRL